VEMVPPLFVKPMRKHRQQLGFGEQRCAPQ
jgi:hypothetical protein